VVADAQVHGMPDPPNLPGELGHVLVGRAVGQVAEEQDEVQLALVDQADGGLDLLARATDVKVADDGERQVLHDAHLSRARKNRDIRPFGNHLSRKPIHGRILPSPPNVSTDADHGSGTCGPNPPQRFRGRMMKATRGRPWFDALAALRRL